MNKKILHSVFEDAAARFPDRIAVEQGGRTVTYNALNKQADTIAHALTEIGVGRDSVVGVLAPGGIEYVAAMLGVFKSGGIFMPLDEKIPWRRFSKLMNKASPAAIITTAELKDSVISLLAETELADKTGCLLVLREDAPVTVARFKNGDWVESAKDYPQEALPLISDPDDGNYIVHTSGTTGEPKAILGSHKCLSHFIHWEIGEFGLNESVRVSQLSPVTNDVVFRDVFAALLSGGTACIPDEETAMNTALLLKWMEESRVTLVHTVPALFRLLLREIEDGGAGEILPDLRRILLVGEPLYGSDAIRWMDIFGDRIELVNLYGASETLVKSFFRIKEKPAELNKIVPVGKPISNTGILILKDDDLCGIGEIGEICIKTPFITKGYYNDPEMTAERFVQNPLASDKEDIIYKTGDMGRYLPDRSAEFIGRLDNQVKVNGLRVELSEIEAVLSGCDSIDQALVSAAKTSDHENRLISYYTERQPIDPAAIREYLQDYLPDYMIPSFFVRLDEFPLNISGKIDRKALPQPEELMYEKVEYEASAGETEEKLAQIWCDVLGFGKVGVNNNFFEIGGNSLTAIRIVSRIYKTFEVEVAIRDFFENASIRELAKLIDQWEKPGYTEIRPIEVRPHYDLSHAQRRLWILGQMEGGGFAGNVPGAYLIRGDLNVAALNKVFQTLIKRHESLRTTFIPVAGEPKQMIHDEIDFILEEIDLSAELNLKLAREFAGKEAYKTFDLSAAPLFRAKLLKTAADQFVFLMNMHHIISDAWSLDMMAEEILMLYQAYSKSDGNPLPPLKIQYKDFAAWQNDLLEGDSAKELKEYWLQKLSGRLPVLDLQADFPRPAVKTFNGDTIISSIDRESTSALNKLARDNNASLFMVLVSLLKALLYRYTAQEDIIVGTAIAGRGHPDLENQIGFYVNMLPLRDEIKGDDSFTAVLQKVKQTTTEAYDRLFYPFDALVEDLNLETDPGRSPVFDVAVILQEKAEIDARVDDIWITAFEYDAGISKYDLDFVFVEKKDTIELTLEYNSDLFRGETVIRMLDNFEYLVAGVAENPTVAVSEIEFVQTAESREEIEISTEFNF